MQGMMTWGLRHPLTLALLLVVATLLGASQLGKVEVYISPQSLTIADSPARLAQQRALQQFGSDRIVILYVQDERLFAAERIQALRDAVKQINALPCVSHTRSLFDVPYLRERDEEILSAPYLAETPASPEQAKAIREAALANPFVRENLLSLDGQAMAINIYLHPSVDDPEFDTRLTASLDRIAAGLRPQFAEAFHVGAPQVRRDIAARIWSDMRTIGPLSVVLLLVTLAAVLRRPSGILIPMITAAITLVLTLGAMGALAIPVNIMTAIVPVLLVVIGSTEDIHMINEYYAAIARGRTRKSAVRSMIKRMALAVSLTFLTTLLGFLAIGFNPIQLVREFVLVSALGLVLGFLVTVLSVPLLLRFFGEKRLPRHIRSHAPRPLSYRLVAWVLKRRRMVLASSLVFSLAAGLLATQVRVNNSSMDYLAKDSEVGRQIATVQQRLAGIETFNILVDGQVQGTFERVRYLQELQKIQRYIAAQSAFDTSLSLADHMVLANSVVDDLGLLELPEEDDVVETLILFLDAGKVRQYVDQDYSQANILVRHGLSSSAQLAGQLRRLQEFIGEQVDPALQITITGNSVLSSEASDYLSASQVQSLVFMLLAIFIIIAILFVNLRAGLLAVAPNLLLLAGLFGVMGLLHMPLDAGSAMIAAVALGVSVDHTMHLMVRYYSLTRRRTEPYQALLQATAIEMRPIVASAVALASGFLVLTLSGFTPVVNFGLLSALVMLLALYANFFLTPALLSYVRLSTLWDLLSVPMRRGLKSHCKLFSGMNELQIRHVLSLGVIRNYRAGSAVFGRGSAGNELFVLLSGEVQVCAVGEQGERLVTDEKPGDRLFGAVALVRDAVYGCGAQVKRDSRILVLDWQRLRQIQQWRPRTGSLLYRNLSVILAGRVADDVLPVR